MSSPPKRPLTLGVFITSAEDKYENAIVRGALAVATQANAQLVAFTSGAVRSYHGFEAQRNILYDLVSANTVDGLIISGALAHPITTEEMAAFCQRYQPIPMVSIALPLQGIPGLLVDSVSSLRLLIRHLVREHGYRNVGFIRGPVGQREAEDRYQAYLDVMAEHRLPFDSGRVAQGDYTRHSGEAAMRDLLARGLPLQAVVCANDTMALGALEVLTEHGLCVPRDVALTGFDDTEAGRNCSTPLTTVRQSAYMQGQYAAHLLLRQIAGESVSPQTTMPAQMIIRQSCGCNHDHTLMDVDYPVAPPNAPLEFPELETEQAILHYAFVQAINPNPLAEPPDWVVNLAEALWRVVNGESLNIFLKPWATLLNPDSRPPGDVDWRIVLNDLHTLLHPYAMDNALLHHHLQPLWTYARGLVDEMEARWQTRLRMRVERQAAVLRELSEALVTTFDMPSLLQVMTNELPRLGVQACELALYEDPAAPATWSRLVMAYDMHGPRTLPHDGVRFASSQLSPFGLGQTAEPTARLVEALYSKEAQIGFVVLALPAHLTDLGDAVRGVLSSALQGVLLLEQRREVEATLRQHQNELEKLVAARTLALEQEIAERRRAEEVVRTLNADLEQRVADRTHSLDEARHEVERLLIEAQQRAVELSLARDAAEAANRAKSEFLASMSHELRTPLNGVLGYAQILKRQKNLTPAQHEAVDIIQKSGEHLLTLIEDVLDLSKIEARKLELAPTNINLPAFLHNLVGIVRTRADQKDLDFVFTTHGNLPSVVRVDEHRLRQVLLNLLSNAIKFTPQGQVSLTVTISAQPSLAPQVLARFDVHDSGVGIPPEALGRLFRPFEQAGDWRTRAEGTGLGLAISQRLVRAMGGDITVHSVVGQGSHFAFEIILPLAADATTTPDEDYLSVVGYTGPRRRVLVVDDKEYNRSVLVNLLEPLGFDMHDATDGREAVTLARALHPDLILMDLVMPEMTGIEATRLIRQEAALARTIIIAASASAFEHDRQLALEAGCNDFIPKPVQAGQLLRLIRQYLGLEWERTTNLLAADPVLPLVPPSREILQELREQALRGDIESLTLMARNLPLRDARLAPFAKRLGDMAREFDSERIAHFVENYLAIN